LVTPQSVIIHLSLFTLELFFDLNHRAPAIKAATGTNAVRQLLIATVWASGQLDAVQRVVRAPFAAARF
jgi:hypothetical protein